MRNQRDEVCTEVVVTNHAADLTLDCNQNDTLKTSDNLGSVVKALQELGILGGSTA